MSILSILLGGLAYLNFNYLPKNHIANFLSSQPKLVYIEGKIVDEPELSITYYKFPKMEFTLAADKLKIDNQWFNTQGLIKVYLWGLSKNYNYSDRLILFGNLERPSGPRNPGGFDFRSYLQIRKIYAILTVRQPLEAIYLGSQKANSIISLIFRLRQKINMIIDSNLSGINSQLFAAITTGRRYDIPHNVYMPFINTGTVHILSISGLHVVIIGFIFLFIFKLVNLPRKFSYILTIIFLWGYAVLTGAKAPIIRSVVMMNAYLVSLLIEKDFDIWNALSISALVILLFNPMQIFDIGFQLSYLSIISIGYISPKIELPGILKLFSVSAAAWIGIMPITSFYFNIFSPVTVFANLLIVPLTTVVMYVGFSFIFFGLIFMPLARVFAQSTWLCLEVMIRTANLLNKVPFGHFYIPKPGIFFILIYFVLLVLLLERNRLRLSTAKFFIILLLAINIFIYKSVFKPVSNLLTVTFLDVGHGDSIFIEFPSGGNMLIDGGERILPYVDKGQDTLIPFLCTKGIMGLDAVLSTHPDADHLGGLVTVLENFKTRYVLDSGIKKSRQQEQQLLKNYLNLINKKQFDYKDIKAGQKITGFDDIQILILNPPEEFIDSPDYTNDNSVVIKIIYKNFSLLLTADIEEKAQQQILKYKNNLKSDIIKIPHHGSLEGDIEYKFLEAVSPKVAIISVGKTRKGFPAGELIGFLDKMDIQTFQTKTNGAISVLTDGYNYKIKTMEGI